MNQAGYRCREIFSQAADFLKILPFIDFNAYEIGDNK